MGMDIKPKQTILHQLLQIYQKQLVRTRDFFNLLCLNSHAGTAHTQKTKMFFSATPVTLVKLNHHYF